MAQETELQRAKGRGQNLFAPLLPGDDRSKPNLIDPDVTGTALETFITGALAHRSKAAKGESAFEDAVQAITDDAQALSQEFMGKGTRYTTEPLWHRPEGVGRHVKIRYGLTECTMHDAVQTLLVQSASTALEISRLLAAGEIDDATAQFRSEVLAEETSYALLGLPLTSD